jgi:hypothetical protein
LTALFNQPSPAYSFTPFLLDLMDFESTALVALDDSSVVQLPEPLLEKEKQPYSISCFCFLGLIIKREARI